ncbi:NAD(P)-dependent oxidoreductase [Alkalibacterium kapii]|uniref:2-hydroxyacid dehydrogenase n=1 Tax=Alkalibacterium kapii TaxID=426704 RepID=A0A511AUZ8_9LACT|nr:NAD(P)-dependent oxidoreductase [Alkalibacterium kapii]GEK92025.1 2-hydroxyacid dehydrogenase [Alkalibacterium kapii]
MPDKLLSYVSLSDEQRNKINKVAPSYDIIESISDVSDISEIKGVFGWNKEEVSELLDDPSHKLQWIQLTSAGVDYVDLLKLKKQGITLTTTSGIHKYAIAESVMGMILSHTRKIGYSLIQQRQKKWEPSEELSEMNQKTMLIVGAGSIGKQTGKVARAFGMKTIGVNRSGGSVDYMDEMVTQDRLKEVLPEADVVVNILPLTDETENLFDLELFRVMKPSALFINVGRGQTVVTQDLLKALDNKWIEFAALDVVDQEPLPEDHPIYEREDVLLTPHISGKLEDYIAAVFPIFIENLREFSKQRIPDKNVVDYERGY